MRPETHLSDLLRKIHSGQIAQAEFRQLVSVMSPEDLEGLVLLAYPQLGESYSVPRQSPSAS